MSEQQQPQQPVQPVQPAQPVQPVQPVQPQQQNANAYQTIIEQQQAQIQALINQTNALNSQITQMVAGGAQFSQPMQPAQPVQQLPGQMQEFAPEPQFPNYYAGNNPLAQLNTPALSDNTDWSLEALGKEIGKPRKE